MIIHFVLITHVLRRARVIAAARSVLCSLPFLSVPSLKSHSAYSLARSLAHPHFPLSGARDEPARDGAYGGWRALRASRARLSKFRSNQLSNRLLRPMPWPLRHDAGTAVRFGMMFALLQR